MRVLGFLGFDFETTKFIRESF